MKRWKIQITREGLIQYGIITVGSLLYALGQLYFIKPLYIPMGGVAGIALVTNFLWNAPIGTVSLVLNLPLFFLGWRAMGREFFFKTVYSTVVSSLMLDALDPFIPAFDGEVLLAAIFGGLVMGAGFGLIFRVGGTAGGIDIISKYLNQTKDMSVGAVSFIINIVVILVSAIIYRNPDSALYAILSSYATNIIVDKIVYGMDVQKNAMIITNKAKEVSDAIMKELGRGVTAMNATGMYTGDQRTVLICVVRRHETSVLKRLIFQQDENAFLSINSISEVFGRNFKHFGQ